MLATTPTLLTLALLCGSSQDPDQIPDEIVVETFGLRSVERATVLEAVGEPALAMLDEEALLDRLRAVSGVEDASVALIAVEEGSILYVGIREEGSAFEPAHRDAPTGELTLPAEIVQAYDAFLAAAHDAVLAGEAGEDHAAGHMLMKFAPARAVQRRFEALADEHFEALRGVLRDARDAEHRRAAAMVIAYHPDKLSIKDDLVRATRDSDATVRNNAIRNLGVLMDWAKKQRVNLAVDKQPFFGLLGSLEWSDRNKALLLLALAGVDAGDLPDRHRGEILAALGEMASWRSDGHSMPAALVLGRLAGRSDLQTVLGARRTAGDPEARSKWVEKLLGAASAPR